MASRKRPSSPTSASSNPPSSVRQRRSASALAEQAVRDVLKGVELAPREGRGAGLRELVEDEKRDDNDDARRAAAPAGGGGGGGAAAGGGGGGGGAAAGGGGGGASSSAAAAVMPETWPLAPGGRSLMMDCMRDLTENESKSRPNKNKTCILCQPATFIKFSTSSNYAKHLKSQHPREWAAVLDAGKAGYRRAKAKLDDILSDIDKKISASKSMFASMRRSSSDLLKAQMLYVVHIITKGISFNSLDDPFLKEAQGVLHSSLAPNSNFARTVAVPLLVQLAEARNVELFSKIPFVAGITDTWSRHGRVTVVNLRAINDAWEFITRTVGMFVMVGAHSSEAEASYCKGVIDSVTSDETTIVAVASDTENKAKKTCRLIGGEANRVGCAGHILHLAVQDFIRDYEAKDVVDKIRGIARAFRVSPTWCEQLAWAQKPEIGAGDAAAGGSVYKYKIDNDTRWSSMYEMVKRGIMLHEPTKKAVAAVDADAGEFSLSADELTKARSTVDALAPVAILTTEMQATKTATLSRLPYRLKQLYASLSNMQTPAASTLLRCVENRFKEVFVTTDGNVHLALRAAAVDPAYGDLDFLDNDGRDAVWKHVLDEAVSVIVLPSMSDEDKATGFDESGAPTSSEARSRCGAVSSALQVLRAKFEETAQQRREAGILDPLSYWKAETDPLIVYLRPLARALLSAPASSADSERSFSSAGFIDDPLRGRMDDEGLADLVLIRDWANSEGPQAVAEAVLRKLQEIASK